MMAIVWDIVVLDHEIFRWINMENHHALLDAILTPWRNKYTWVPLYVFILAFAIMNFRRQGLYLIAFLLLSVGTSDLLSSHLIKKSVERLRPCNNELIKNDVRLLVRCGSGYSFTSSHATNHFSIAVFLFLTLGRRYRRARWLLIGWAAIVGYAQIYVGVHYPMDVFFGSLLGAAIGAIIAEAHYRFVLKGSYSRLFDGHRHIQA